MLGGFLARAGLVLAALLLTRLVVIPGVGAAEPSGVGGEAGELVSLAELCAFRAPLVLSGEGEAPAACTPVVDRLRRLREADPACFERWLAEGAVPACAPAQS